MFDANSSVSSISTFGFAQKEQNQTEHRGELKPAKTSEITTFGTL